MLTSDSLDRRIKKLHVRSQLAKWPVSDCGLVYVRTLIGQPLMSDARVTFRGHLCSVSNVMKSWRRLPIGETVTAEPKLERDLMFYSRQACTYQGVKQL